MGRHRCQPYGRGSSKASPKEVCAARRTQRGGGAINHALASLARQGDGTRARACALSRAESSTKTLHHGSERGRLKGRRRQAPDGAELVRAVRCSLARLDRAKVWQAPHTRLVARAPTLPPPALAAARRHRVARHRCRRQRGCLGSGTGMQAASLASGTHSREKPDVESNKLSL